MGQDDVTLAPTSLAIGLGAVVADRKPRRRLEPAGELPGDVGEIAAPLRRLHPAMPRVAEASEAEQHDCPG